MIVANSQIRIRHVLNLVLRNSKCLISDVELDYAYLGRWFMVTPGFDACTLLVAASDKFKGVVDISELSKGQEAH